MEIRDFDRLKDEVTPDLVFNILVWGDLEDQKIRDFLPKSVLDEITNCSIDSLSSKINFDEFSYFFNETNFLLVILCSYKGKLNYSSENSIQSNHFDMNFITMVKTPFNHVDQLLRSYFFFTSNEDSLKKYLKDFNFLPVKQ